MSEAAARRVALRASGLTSADVDGSKIVLAVIQAADPNAPPPARVPSSKTIARRLEKAQAMARTAEAARVLRAQVQPGLKPPRGKLFAADLEALVLRGPNGGLGSTDRMIRTLVPLAAGGRHPAVMLVAAGNWRDELALREALAALAPKLNAVGVRICHRRAGLRMAKVKPS